MNRPFASSGEAARAKKIRCVFAHARKTFLLVAAGVFAACGPHQITPSPPIGAQKVSLQQLDKIDVGRGIISVAVHPKKPNLVAIATHPEPKIQLWDLSSKHVVAEVNIGSNTIARHGHKLRFTPDGRFLVTLDDFVPNGLPVDDVIKRDAPHALDEPTAKQMVWARVLDSETLVEKATLWAPRSKTWGRAMQFCISGDQSHIAMVAPGAITVYDLVSGNQRIWIDIRHPLDDKRLDFLGEYISCHPTKPWVVVAPFRYPHDGISPSRTLATDNDVPLLVYDYETGRRVMQISGHSTSPVPAYGPRGDVLLTTSRNWVYVHEAKRNLPTLRTNDPNRIRDPETGATIREFMTAKFPTRYPAIDVSGELRSIAFFHSTSWFLAGEDTAQTTLWDYKTGERLSTIPMRDIFSISIAANDQLVVMAQHSNILIFSVNAANKLNPQPKLIK